MEQAGRWKNRALMMGRGRGLERVGSLGMEFCEMLPKNDTLPGSLQIEWKRCGRANCCCTRGSLHGPYYRLFWRDSSGKQRTKYVPWAEVDKVKAAIDRYHELYPAIWEMRQKLTELRRLEKEWRDE